MPDGARLTCRPFHCNIVTQPRGSRFPDQVLQVREDGPHPYPNLCPKLLDLKSTLNLPRTAFPMKASLPQNEPKHARGMGAEKALSAHPAGARRCAELRVARRAALSHRHYSLGHRPQQDPQGHGGEIEDHGRLSRAVRSRWDCHGLPIETQVEKELGGKKGSVPPAEFRRMCREFASRYVDQHRRDFKRLGVLGQWEDPYLTMSPQYEATIADAFHHVS